MSAAMPGSIGTGTTVTDEVVHTEHVMGTVVSFRVLPGPAVPVREVRCLVAEACRVLHRHDAIFSTWLPESPLSRLRRGEASIADVPPEIPEVLGLCEHAAALSGGWFDPWAMPGGVDPTGLVKGWSLDRALDVLRSGGVDAALLNAGGDLTALGRPAPGQAWRVGIRHPWRADRLSCVVRLDAAIATSGTYERGPHLIDPHTRRPATRAASATVAGPSLALADALATGLAVGGDDALERIAALEGYEAYLVHGDGTEVSTEGMAFAT